MNHKCNKHQSCVMYFKLTAIILSCLVFWTNAQSAPKAEYWKLDDVVNYFSNGSINVNSLSAMFSDLTKRATGEMDRLYHQLEGVLEQAPVATKLDPSVINENCTCYCRCPHSHGSVSTKVVNNIKDKVMDLKSKFENVRQSIIDKFHVQTKSPVN
ncbi:uncharacterized protein LOC124360711 [Homalodisca vitripennis]|uniref:uncharacterized protein LOC124360711 n=1 Tax=Homalodisca vitripennis TaxID=197043 RepID=UPI001EEA8846|nr:uncharacterized protein LOC124360711 [Homalodisca vitripennis]